MSTLVRLRRSTHRRAGRWLRRHRQDERGDVPGWVMITVMSAGLVAVITAAAGPQLRRMVVDALTAVGG